MERRSETKRNLSDCPVKLRRSESGVLVSLRKSSSKWTVCRDLAIVSSLKTSVDNVETKRSKRSSSTISEDDLKPVPNDLKSSSPIRRHKRNISEPCVLVTVDSDEEDEDEKSAKKKNEDVRKRNKRNSRALIRSTRGDSNSKRKDRKIFGAMSSTQYSSSPGEESSSNDVILVTSPPSDDDDDDFEPEILSPSIKGQPALERKSSSLFAKTSFEGKMDVAVFQKNSSKISWSENLNVELLNGTLCWYVIFEREAREFQSYHYYESLNSRNTHSNTKPTQVQSKSLGTCAGMCSCGSVHGKSRNYGLDEGCDG